LVSTAEREETLYRVTFKGASLLKVALVTAAAMLAICLRALVETTDTAKAEDSLPHNGKIAFTSYNDARTSADIYVMNADGTHQERITNIGDGAASEPAWSPDGTRIAFERGTNEDVDLTLSVAERGSAEPARLRGHAGPTENFALDHRQ
jgi:dipeptidyl aminopeptidase/acylaminoacyl peptidase